MPVPTNITGLDEVNREALNDAIMEQEVPDLTEPSNRSRDQEVPASSENDTGIHETSTGSETGTGGEPTVNTEEEVFEEITRPSSPLPTRRTAIPCRFEEYLDQNRRVGHSYIRNQQFQEDLHQQGADDRSGVSYDSEEEYDHWNRNLPGIDIQNVTPRIFCTTGRRQ